MGTTREERANFRICLALSVLILFVVPVSGGIIAAGTILSGSASQDLGSSGFSVSGLNFTVAGRDGAGIDPFFYQSLPCTPGTFGSKCRPPGTYSVSAFIVGALGSPFQLDGIGYGCPPGPPPPPGEPPTSGCSELGIRLGTNGSITLPDYGNDPGDWPSQITVITPFTAGVLFSSPDVFFSAAGAGIATINLSKTCCGSDGVGPLYVLSTATYQFTPIPEPGTLALVGLGLAGTFFFFRVPRRTRAQAS